MFINVNFMYFMSFILTSQQRKVGQTRKSEMKLFIRLSNATISKLYP